MADDLTTWTLVAETKEWVGPITVLADGAPVSSFEVTVTEGQARPTTWTAATSLDGGLGVLVGTGTSFPLVTGKRYAVWTRHTDSPEIPVTKVGIIKVI